MMSYVEKRDGAVGVSRGGGKKKKKKEGGGESATAPHPTYFCDTFHSKSIIIGINLLASSRPRESEDGMRRLAYMGWVVRWLVAGLMAPALMLGLPGSAVRAAPANAAATTAWQALPHGALA